MAYHIVTVITTILADIGVDCDHVAPANVTAYWMLRVYNVDPMIARSHLLVLTGQTLWIMLELNIKEIQ